ncbi:MAG: hypothetical protein ABIT38_01445 [Gemmatimonadaceae bacterium]
MTTRFAVASALLVLSAGPVFGQGAQIFDQGSFTITTSGQRSGREDFRIEGTPGSTGVEYVARATVVFGDRRLTPRLSSDSSGAPSAYVIESKGTTTGTERWSGSISRGRVSARINSARGESAREYVVTDGALIIDDDVYHQYFFVARRNSEGSVAIVIPRRNTQMVVKVATSGTEHLTIGTTDIEARHIVITEPSGSTRDIWVDSKGRVLKVAIQSRNIIALRDDPPQG